MGHMRTVQADENGTKAGMQLSWGAVKGIAAVLALVFTVSWTVMMLVRSLDQKLIAAQMAATTTLIRTVEENNSAEHVIIYETQVGIAEDVEEIKEALR